MKKIIIATLFLPLVSWAATPRDFKALIEFIIEDILGPLVFLVASIAFLAFIWGVTRYIFSAGDENKKEYGRNIMLYGVIALFVMVSVWGLVQILKNTFFEGSNAPVNVNTSGGYQPPAGGSSGDDGGGATLPPPVDPGIPGNPFPF